MVQKRFTVDRLKIIIYNIIIKNIKRAGSRRKWRQRLASLRMQLRVYAVELIGSTGLLGFQTFEAVFCMYNKLSLAAEMLS